MRITEIRKTLKSLSDKKKAVVLKRFFKTAPGEYGEGDIFIGVTVPSLRKLSRESVALPLSDTVQLLRSPIHEERLLALLILVLKFEKSAEPDKEKIYTLYLRHTRYINNWDLVDLTAHHIIGAFLADKDQQPLSLLARSQNLWERRMAIIATFHFIRNGQFAQTLKMAEILIEDNEDLIHKAVGWMLRETGKRDLASEEGFLKKYYRRMPRTMLRYAIERFPENKRQAFLKGKI
ncbi:MAG: DNA alkylation repair protein [Candidatus Omnitrophota bacterium]